MPALGGFVRPALAGRVEPGRPQPGEPKFGGTRSELAVDSGACYRLIAYTMLGSGAYAVDTDCPREISSPGQSDL